MARKGQKPKQKQNQKPLGERPEATEWLMFGQPASRALDGARRKWEEERDFLKAAASFLNLQPSAVSSPTLQR